jgi:hypothetical protein
LNRKVEDLEDVRYVMNCLKEVREKEANIDGLITPIEDMYALLLRYEVRVPKEETSMVSDLRYGWKKLRKLATEMSDNLTRMQVRGWLGMGMAAAGSMHAYICVCGGGECDTFQHLFLLHTPTPGCQAGCITTADAIAVIAGTPGEHSTCPGTHTGSVTPVVACLAAGWVQARAHQGGARLCDGRPAVPQGLGGGWAHGAWAGPHGGGGPPQEVPADVRGEPGTQQRPTNPTILSQCPFPSRLGPAYPA